MPCAKCGSEATIDGVRILERHGDIGEHKADLSAVAYNDPGAVFLKGEVATPIVGRVCGDCGYLELYVVDPGALLAVARRLAGL